MCNLYCCSNLVVRLPGNKNRIDWGFVVIALYSRKLRWVMWSESFNVVSNYHKRECCLPTMTTKDIKDYLKTTHSQLEVFRPCLLCSHSEALQDSLTLSLLDLILTDYHNKSFVYIMGSCLDKETLTFAKYKVDIWFFSLI